MSAAEIDEITTKTETKKTTKITQNVQLKFLNERCKNVISLTEYSVKSSNTVNTRLLYFRVAKKIKQKNWENWKFN